MTFGAPKKKVGASVWYVGTPDSRKFHRNLDPEEENSQVADPVDETRKWPSLYVVVGVFETNSDLVGLAVTCWLINLAMSRLSRLKTTENDLETWRHG